MDTEGVAKVDPDPWAPPQNRGLFAVIILFTLIAIIAVVGRFWGRSIRPRRWWWDDYLVLGGLFFYACLNAEGILLILKGGLGHHLSQIPPKNLENDNLKAGTFGQYAYALAMGLIRSSICALYLRIFVMHKVFRGCVWAVIIANVGWVIYNIFIVTFRCIPASKNWNIMEPGHCINQLIVVGTVAGTGLFLEVIIWTMPLPLIWRLNTSTSNKLALTGVFGLGLFDIVVGILRVTTVTQVNKDDPTYSEVTSIYWITVEPSVAILVSCLPAHRPLLEKVIASGFFQSLRSRLMSTKSERLNSDTKTESQCGRGLNLRVVPQTSASVFTGEKTSSQACASTGPFDKSTLCDRDSSRASKERSRSDELIIHMRRDIMVEE